MKKQIAYTVATLALAAVSTATLRADPVSYGVLDQTAFSRKLEISFDGYSGTTTLTDFPVLVKFSTAISSFSYGDFALQNGGDLRFADADGNLLPHEIDTWNESGVSTVWVKVPSLTSSTRITACYGCDNPPAVSAKDVWDDDFVGVWHLGESALPLKESSETTRDFSTATGSTIVYGAEGAVGGSVNFGGGTGNALVAADHDALDGFTQFTLEAWTKQSAHKNNAGILAKRKGAYSEGGISYYMYDYNNKTKLVASTNGWGSTVDVALITPETSGNWQHQVYSIDMTSTANNVKGYLNGNISDTSSTGARKILAGSGKLTLGNLYTNAQGNAFNGQIDEVRISKVARAADWIKATHDTVMGDNFASYSPMIITAAFARQMEISFDGYSGSTTLTNFPVLVKLSTAISGFNYANFALPNGGDLRFADANGIILPHEIDTWNESGVSTVWVKVPSLTSSTRITACYGCDNPPAVSAKDVWDDDFVGVWHLGESALPLKESSETTRDFSTATGSTIVYGAEGAVGGSVNFDDGTGNALIADDHDAFDGFTQFTFEAWTKQSAHKASAGIITKRKGTYNDGQISYYMYDNNGPTKICASISGSGYKMPMDTALFTPVASGNWQYQVCSADLTASTDNVKGYLDGSLKKTTSTNLVGRAIYSGATSLCLGNLYAGAPDNAFNGQIDEVRISRVARSGDWIQATHDTVASANFASYDVKVEYGMLNTNAFAKSMGIAFTGYAGTTLTDFPVLVKLSTEIADFDYADFTLSNGGDLRFADADGNLLPHEIDTWNENGVSTVWVKVPSLYPSALITAYYGCSNPPPVSPEDVWGNGFVGVWHLGESALPMKESSGVSTDFSSANNTVALGATGIVGASVDFSTTTANNYLIAADDDDLDGFDDFTVEMWTYQEAYRTDNYAALIAKRDGAYTGESFFAYQDYSGNKYPTFAFNTNSTQAARVSLSATARPETGAWTHNAFTRNTGTGALAWYLDGANKGSKSAHKATIYAGSTTLKLGGGGGQQAFPGKIDEVRISKCARSADWIKATHDTVTMANFATYAVDGSQPEPKAFSITFR